MASLKSIAASTRDGFNIDPRRIRIEPGFNARDFTLPENIAHIEQLKVSIRENGVKTPLTVRAQGEEILLSDGESRLRAVWALIKEGVPIETVPCQSEERYADEAARTAGMVIRNTGKQLSMPEQGEVYRRLLAYGWDEPKVVAKVGYSALHIRNCLALVAAPVELQQMVHDGVVAPTTAVNTIRREGDNAPRVLREAADEAKKQGKSRVSGSTVSKAHTTIRNAHMTPFDTLVGVLQEIGEGRIADPVTLARTTLVRMGYWKEALRQTA